jgi:hypothetical protein
MPTLQEVRQKYPAYNDMSDQQLADALYKKFYPDMPRDQFNAKIGFAPQQQPRTSRWFTAPPIDPQQEREQAQAAFDTAAARTVRSVVPQGGKQMGPITGFMDEAGKGFPILGAFAQDTPQAAALREQDPERAAAARGLGRVIGSVPAMVLGPGGILGTAATYGSLGGADVLARGGSGTDALEQAGIDAGLGAGAAAIGPAARAMAPYVGKVVNPDTIAAGTAFAAKAAMKAMGLPEEMAEAAGDFALAKILGRYDNPAQTVKNTIRKEMGPTPAPEGSGTPRNPLGGGASPTLPAGASGGPTPGATPTPPPTSPASAATPAPPGPIPSPNPAGPLGTSPPATGAPPLRPQSPIPEPNPAQPTWGPWGRPTTTRRAPIEEQLDEMSRMMHEFQPSLDDYLRALRAPRGQ